MNQSNSMKCANEYFDEYKEYMKVYDTATENKGEYLDKAHKSLFEAARCGHKKAQDEIVKKEMQTLDTIPVEEEEEAEVEEQIERAYRVLNEMAGYGHTKAKFLVAGMKRDGYGTDMDNDGAEKLYEELVALDYEPAIIYLMDLAVYDLGTEKAFAIYKKAAAHNIAKAHYLLGLCYEHGLGVKVDFQKAIKHYSQAYNGGIKKAETDTVRILLQQGYQKYVEGKYNEALKLCNEIKKSISKGTKEEKIIYMVVLAACYGNIDDADNFNYMRAMYCYNKLRGLNIQALGAMDRKVEGEAADNQKAAIEKSTGIKDEWITDLVFTTASTPIMATEDIVNLIRNVPLKQALLKASLPIKVRLAYWAKANRAIGEMGIDIEAFKEGAIDSVAYDKSKRSVITSSGKVLVRFFDQKTEKSSELHNEKPIDYREQTAQFFRMVFLSSTERKLVEKYKEKNKLPDNLLRLSSDKVDIAIKSLTKYNMKQQLKRYKALMEKMAKAQMTPSETAINSLEENRSVVKLTVSQLQGVKPVSSKLQVSTDAVPIKPKFYSNCGTKLNKNANFCVNCGTKIVMITNK